MVNTAAAATAFVAFALGAGWAQAEITPEQSAQFALLRAEARTFEYGDGVTPRDPVRAQEKYCEAARLGDAEAQYSLGWMYMVGRGSLERDDGLAAFFLGLAAEQGHVQARNLLRMLSAEAYSPGCMQDPVVPDFHVEPPVFQDPEEPFVPATPEQARVVKLVERIAPDYGVHPQLAIAVIRAESNFDPNARSPRNAQGLMQLVPETSVRFNVKSPYDPLQNVRGGLSYLRWLLAYFEGDVALVAAAYNSGEQTVNRYRGVPPYAETRAYVKRVREFYKQREHPYDARVTEPSALLRARAANAR
jgi:hypothetical protein